MFCHTAILSTYAVVSVTTAGAIIGGDGEPVSPSTVNRLCRAGVLTKRMGKVTTASLRAYLEGSDQWQRGSGEQRGAAASTGSKGAVGSRSETAPALTGSATSNGAPSPPVLRLLDKVPTGNAKRKP